MKKFLLSIAAMALFAAPTFAQELADNQQEVETEYYGYNDTQNGPGSKFFKSYDCVLTRNEGHTYTLNNAFNSGLDMTFSFDLEKVDENGWCPIDIELSENVFYNENNNDFVLHNVDDSPWTIQTMSGTTEELVHICFRNGSQWLSPQDNEDGEWFDYYAQFFVWAANNIGYSSWSECHYMTFYFDEDGGDAAVAKVEIDADVPVEIYNLQGVKVANPSNGLYIVRQGKKVQKIMVK